MPLYTFDISNSSCADISVAVDVRADSEDQAVDRMRRFARLTWAGDERWFAVQPDPDELQAEVDVYTQYGEEVGVDGIVELRFYLGIGRQPADITADMIGEVCDEEDGDGSAPPF